MGAVTVDDFHSGHAAALAGGTTFHIDFALPRQHNLSAGFAAWEAKAAPKACMDYGAHAHAHACLWRGCVHVCAAASHPC